MKTKLFLFFLRILSNFSSGRVRVISSVFLILVLVNLFPGPLRLLTTCAQCFSVVGGRFLHLLTIKTQALQISPDRESFSLKQFLKEFSYFPLSVNLELKERKKYILIYITKYDRDHYLLDFALQMTQPSTERNIFGLW